VKNKRHINLSDKHTEKTYMKICKRIFSPSVFLSIKKRYENNYKKGRWMPKATMPKASVRENKD